MLLRNALLLCIAYQCYFAKELEQHGSSHSLFPRVLHRHKRQRPKYEHHDEQKVENNINNRGLVSGDDSTSTTCSPSMSSPRLEKIIKTLASIDDGAIYLNTLKNVASSRECFNKCCQTTGCDTALYQDKNEHRCFLFDCHERCHFKDHLGYEVWETPKEEEELAQLNDNTETNKEVERNGQSSSFTSDHTSYQDDGDTNDESVSDSNDNSRDNSDHSSEHVQTSNQKHIAPHTAGISEACVSDISCEDPNAACVNAVCHCKNGFYNRNGQGLCRQVCSKSQFECNALGTSGRGPECISKSQVCDSYMQCADGSDEFNCHKQAPSSWMAGKQTNMNNISFDSSQMGKVPQSSMQKNIIPPQQPHQEQQQQQHQQQQQQKLPESVMSNLQQNNRKQQTNEVNSLHSSGTGKQPGRDNGEMNSNVRPNAMPPRAHNPGMNNGVHTNPKDNQHEMGSFKNTNTNAAYSQSRQTDMHQNKQDTDSRSQFHQNDNGYKSPSRNMQPSKTPKYPKPNPSHPSQQYVNNNSPKSEPFHNPSNVAYSETGPFVQQSVRNENYQKSETKLKPNDRNQVKNAPSQQPHLPLRPKSKSFGGNQNRNGQVNKSSNQISKVKNVANDIHLPKPSSSVSSKPASKFQKAKGTVKNNQFRNSGAHANKVPQSHTSKDVRPNYPSSSLLPSSSLRQPSRQNWFDGNPYLSYSNGNQKPQQQQYQPSKNSQYYEPSRYFPQYSSDSIDSLSPSLLGDTGSQDDYSQFGGSYMDRQKSPNRMSYPMNSGTSGYNIGYPDSSYNSQYNSNNRYNYGGEYGNGNYQDPDFYSTLRNSKDYPLSGLYDGNINRCVVKCSFSK